MFFVYDKRKALKNNKNITHVFYNYAVFRVMVTGSDD